MGICHVLHGRSVKRMYGTSVLIRCALGRAVTCHLLSYGGVASPVAVRARAQLLKEAEVKCIGKLQLSTKSLTTKFSGI